MKVICLVIYHSDFGLSCTAMVTLLLLTYFCLSEMACPFLLTHMSKVVWSILEESYIGGYEDTYSGFKNMDYPANFESF